MEAWFKAACCWAVCLESVAAVVRHDIMSLAAVITFYAFVSLFPFLLLVIYTASTIVPQLDVQNVDVQRVLMHLIGPFVPALQAEKVIQQNISNLAVVGRQIGLVQRIDADVVRDERISGGSASDGCHLGT